jgi:hypothetical protein
MGTVTHVESLGGTAAFAASLPLTLQVLACRVDIRRLLLGRVRVLGHGLLLRLRLLQLLQLLQLSLLCQDILSSRNIRACASSCSGGVGGGGGGGGVADKVRHGFEVLLGWPFAFALRQA